VATAAKQATICEPSCGGIDASYSTSSFVGFPKLSCEGPEGEVAFSALETPPPAVTLHDTPAWRTSWTSGGAIALMRSWAACVVVAIVVCSAILAQAARAAEPVEVARAGKAALLAGDEHKQLCISISFDIVDAECAEAYEGVVTTDDLDAIHRPYLGAAVPAAAARIEVRRAGVLLAGGPTVAGEAYKGVRARSVRFALVRLPKAARTDGLRVRALDAAGSLISVTAPDDEGELLLGRTRLLKGRSRGVTWSVTAKQLSTLTPSLLDVAHETLSRCVVVTLNGVDRGRACESGLPNESLAGIDLARAAGAETCAPPLRLLHGVVDGSVTTVDVVLGDGRRRTAHTVPVGDGRRTYAIATGTGAVRSVTIPGRGVLRLGLAPLSAICTEGGFVSLLVGTHSAALGPLALLLERPPVTPAGPVTTIPGSPAMQVADGPDDTLCIALGGRPLDALGCSIVSPLVSDQLTVVDDLLDAHALALAVPAQVATVRLSSTDRKVVRSIPTDPGTGYSGRYAGHVRFVAMSLTNTARLTRLELLDAAGGVLFDDSDDPDEDNFTVPRVGEARRVGGPRQRAVDVADQRAPRHAHQALPRADRRASAATHRKLPDHRIGRGPARRVVRHPSAERRDRRARGDAGPRRHGRRDPADGAATPRHGDADAARRTAATVADVHPPRTQARDRNRRSTGGPAVRLALQPRCRRTLTRADSEMCQRIGFWPSSAGTVPRRLTDALTQSARQRLARRPPTSPRITRSWRRDAYSPPE
jgi:hypothetical protein